MDGFYLLLGHLAGDYLLQNDYLATNKTNPHPGPDPCSGKTPRLGDGTVSEWIAWDARRFAWRKGHLACALHCTIYTLCIWAFSWHWMPWWGLLVCWLCHFPLDRFRLARLWMDNVSGQKGFASIPGLAPWSVIVVDNTAHLLTLGAIAAVARGVS